MVLENLNSAQISEITPVKAVQYQVLKHLTLGRISSQETMMNRNASYHFVFSNTYGIGYTEIPMEHTFTLADGSQYVRDLRVNEIDVSLVLGSEGGNITIGKGFLYGSSSKGDTAFLLLG